MKIPKPGRLLWGSVASFVVLGVLMWQALPPLLLSLVENKGSEWIGRKIQVGSIDFNPLSLELTVKDIAVDTADGSAKQLTLRRLYVNLELQSLFRLAPVVKAVQLDAPTLALTHWGAGRYDVDDVLQRLNTPADASEPARFAVYNIDIQGGSVVFADRDASHKSVRQHSIRDLTLSLPFISNLDAYQTVEVQPHLAFKLNDVLFDTAAHGTPFASTPRGDLSLKITGLNLEPYLSYLPASLPLKIKSAVLDTDVQIDFQQPPAPAAPVVRVRGKIQLANLQMHNAQGQDMLKLGALRVDMADVRPLERSIKLAQVHIDAPLVHLARSKGGALNWAFPQASAADVRTESAQPAAPWTAELAQLTLQQGSVQWRDAKVQPSAGVVLQDIQIDAENLVWPLPTDSDTSAKMAGSLVIPAHHKKEGGKPGTLKFDAKGTTKDALLKVHLQGLGLGLANPYLANYLEPKITGTLHARMDAHWKDQQLSLSLQQLAVQDFALLPVAGPDASQPMPGFKLLEVKNATADFNTRQIQIASIALNNPAAMLSRDAQGQWSFMRWLKVAPSAAGDKPTPSQKPWKLALNNARLDSGQVRLEDRSAAKTVRMQVTKLQTQLQNLRWDGHNLASQAMPVSVSGTVQSGRTDPGTVDFQGSVRAYPHWQAEGKFKLLELPLHAVYPYVSRHFNVDVLRADASLQGDVQFASRPEGVEIALKSDATLEDVRIKSQPIQQQGSETLGMGEELLRWKSLSVPGIVLTMAPHKPTTFSTQQVVWSDFYARLVVDKNGQINLQDLVKAPAETTATTATTATSVVTAPTQPDAAQPVIQLGSIQLVNGTVDFTDRFIQPNYSADLSDLNGSLSQLSSVRNDGELPMADLVLRGRAEGTARLEITGKLNPLAKPLVLDIRGKVQDLELPPLSTYAVKYAGYGIERGKLSVDVQYNIQPDGHLQASNKIVLNQLTFGEKVPNAIASLPVKLAVALLQDRHGVIDINLPISGSMDDPQFRIGPIILQVLGNIIAKAITSPFSLLASAFSGDSDASMDANRIVFAGGSSTLSAPAQQSLSKLAQVLAQKPSLMVTVTGASNEVAERPAMLHAQLQKLLQNHKRRRAKVVDANVQPEVVLPADEYAALLKEVYRRADIVKPRNVLGLAKEISTAEMEELMLAHIKLNPDAARNLALERSVVVKDYLIAQQIPKERLFLGSAKIMADNEEWSPNAEISLSMP